MSRLNTFDRIAPYYDRLAALIFGSAISDAQRVHLRGLRHAKHILIVGGGTGWLLQDILSMNQEAHVMYVETSAKMIDLSRQNVDPAHRHRVTFFHGALEALDGGVAYDAVVAHFYFDLFAAKDLTSIVKRIYGAMHSAGVLLCADFVDETRWQRVVLWMMYVFFGWTTGMATRRLAPWREILAAEGFIPLAETRYGRGFIHSIILRK